LHLVQEAYVSDQSDLWLFLSETLGQSLHPVVRIDAAAKLGAPELQEHALLAKGAQRIGHVRIGIILHPFRKTQDFTILLNVHNAWIEQPEHAPGLLGVL